MIKSFPPVLFSFRATRFTPFGSSILQHFHLESKPRRNRQESARPTQELRERDARGTGPDSLSRFGPSACSLSLLSVFTAHMFTSACVKAQLGLPLMLCVLPHHPVVTKNSKSNDDGGSSRGGGAQTRATPAKSCSVRPAHHRGN